MIADSFRVLLVAPLTIAETVEEVSEYLRAGWSVVVNQWVVGDGLSRLHVESPSEAGRWNLASFDPGNPEELLCKVLQDDRGFDAIVVPFPWRCATSDTIERILKSSTFLRHDLRVVGVPNNSTSHIGKVDGSSVILVSTTDAHGRAVGEYVVGQLVMIGRGFRVWQVARGMDWNAAHVNAARGSNTLVGKTLGIVGISGRDGSSVAEAALSLGMKVIGFARRSTATTTILSARGALISDDLDEVLSTSDHLSFHVRLGSDESGSTVGMIGGAQIEKIRPGAIVVNTAGASLFDTDCLFEELDRTEDARRIRHLVLDIPFVNRDGTVDLNNKDNTRLLTYSHVTVTPRVAGYTQEDRLAACREVRRKIIAMFNTQAP